MPYQPEAKPAQTVSEPLPARRGQEPTPYQADLRTLSHAAATTVRRSYSAIRRASGGACCGGWGSSL
jgi:hypothetical protein